MEQAKDFFEESKDLYELLNSEGNINFRGNENAA